MKSYMRTVVLLLAGIVIGICLSTLRDDVSAQYPNGMEATSDGGLVSEGIGSSGRNLAKVARPLEVPPLYAFDSKIDDTCQQVILVDSETKRICVYWIKQKANSSTIRLVASKTFEWDLKLDDFNVEGLSSQQIRDQVERGTP